MSMYLAVSRTFGPMRRRLIYLAIAKLGLLGDSVCLGFGGWGRFRYSPPPALLLVSTRGRAVFVWRRIARHLFLHSIRTRTREGLLNT